MKRTTEILGLAAALTACAGPSAGGQLSPNAEGSLARLYEYEVSPAQARQAQEAGYVEVSGTGMVSVEPDRAMVAFAMETQAPSAAEAASANADAMTAVLDAIRRGDFEGLELETYGYALNPQYSSNNQQRVREIVSYIASNNVRATISDVDAVGRVIDSAIGAGANRVASISFGASDTDGARREALAQAVSNARAQAEVIAESLGYRLGPPLEVRGGAARPLPRQADVMMMAERVQAAPTPIEAGDQTVTASVTVKFALGPEIGGR